MKKILCILLLSGAILTHNQAQQEIIVFRGIPEVGMAYNGLEDGVIQKLDTARVHNLDCVITKIGDKYFWKSRDGYEVEKIVGGTFITFQRLDRPDYIRIVRPSIKKGAALLNEASKKFGYTEHLVQNLMSITYYGQVTILQENR